MNLRLIFANVRTWRAFCPAVLFAVTTAATSHADIIYDQSQTTTFTNSIQRSDNSGSSNNVMADDFTLTQNASISQVNVTGRFTPAVLLTDQVKGAIVTIYSDNGGSPGAAIFSETVQPSTPFIPNTLWDNRLPQNTLSIPLSTPFEASAGTTYWLSVQAVTDRPDSTWQWFWTNDSDHPSFYTPEGSAAAQLDNAAWEQYGRWWDPGDSFGFELAGWDVATFTGQIPDTIAINGLLGPRTGVDGQGLDLNFQLEGTFRSVSTNVPEPGSLLAFLVVAAAFIVRRRKG